MAARTKRMAKAPKKDGLWELVKTVVYALLIAGVFRSLLFQPFWIPSGSMKSTLLIGDFLFVSKYAYGYSAHSFPFGLAPFSGRILASEPERGDVIVFKHPRSSEDYVKRLIGLPGDTIQMREGVLYINGEAAPQRPAGEFLEPVVRDQSLQCKDYPRIDGQMMCLKERFIETLPGGREHVVLNADDNASLTDNTREFKVPEGQYFFMGDNRDNSNDSRQSVGMVPFENLVGRADLIALSFGGEFWEVWNWRADRFFVSIE
ncbi:MAG: signal peptidase I [Albimonas sp.]|uniref:signal peptidase I n=1 Tax=Albimonas sp. TaxID=1872425 RepID=UPI0040578819